MIDKDLGKIGRGEIVIDSEIKKIIGERLRKKRMEIDISQEELSSRSSVSCPMISQYENGRTIPSIPTLIKLSNVLGTEPGFFLNYITSSESNSSNEKTSLAENNLNHWFDSLSPQEKSLIYSISKQISENFKNK